MYAVDGGSWLNGTKGVVTRLQRPLPSKIQGERAFFFRNACEPRFPIRSLT